MKRMRWLLPVCAVGVVLLVGVPLLIRAVGGVGLPSRTAGQLLADLADTPADGLSGTLVERADLGLADAPLVTDADGSAAFSSLIAGSHTLRLWYGDPTHVRVTLLGALGESDVIRDGGDLWIWSSTANAATHTAIRPPAATPAGALPLTPLDAARTFLGALADTSTVTAGPHVDIADRTAYQLIITPRMPGSLIAQVRIAIDGQWHIPLRVAVFAAGDAGAAAKPALELEFTQVTYRRPDAIEFQFNPPPGVTVTQTPTTTRVRAAPAVIGAGWTSVLVLRPAGVLATTLTAHPGGLVAGLPKVHGAWGSGRLLSTRLFTALVTDDGRFLIGAVDAAAVLAAATQNGAGQ